MTNKEILERKEILVNKILNLALMVNGLYSQEKEDIDKEIAELQENCNHEEVKEGICVFCGKNMED